MNVEVILAVCQWHTSKVDLNKMMMIIFGNVDPRTGHNISSEHHAIIFTHLKATRYDDVYGLIQKVRKIINDENPEINISERGLRKLRDKYRKNGYQFLVGDDRRSGRPRILTIEGQNNVLKDVLNHTQRGTARKKIYLSTDDTLIKVSRTTVHRISCRGDLVVSVPKQIRISYHFDHHLRCRIAWAHYILNLSNLNRRRIWYGDEMSWPITLTPNVKNDIMMVKKGDQTKTNLFRITKGSTGKCFSLCWFISYEGVLFAHLYEDMMTVDKYRDMLVKFLKPVIAQKSRSMYKLGKLYHDHLTNSDKLHEFAFMDAVIGKGKWLPFSPKLCREQKGHIDIPAFDNGRHKIRAHKRRKMVAKEVCDCELGNGEFVPSASPDHNLIEYGNGYLRKLVWDMVAAGEVEWKGSTKHKMNVIRQTINKLNENRRYFWRLYDGHVDMCRKILASNGAVL